MNLTERLDLAKMNFVTSKIIFQKFRITKKLALQYVKQGIVEPKGTKIIIRTDLDKDSYFRHHLEKSKLFEIKEMPQKESFKDLVESDILYFVNRRYPFNFEKQHCNTKK